MGQIRLKDSYEESFREADWKLASNVAVYTSFAIPSNKRLRISLYLNVLSPCEDKEGHFSFSFLFFFKGDTG